MRKDKSAIRQIVKTIFLIILANFIGIIVFFFLSEKEGQPSLVDNSSIHSVFGTIYALITTFLLVNSWEHFNKTDRSIAEENAALISLWNNTDYLNEPEMTQRMKEVLHTYLNKIRNEEINSHRTHKMVQYTSKELFAIMKVLDRVEFDDPRDPIAFDALLQDFNRLSSARNARIDYIEMNIPFILINFYVLVSVIFWASYLLQIINSFVIYFFILQAVTLFTVLGYMIISDLDDQLNGLIQVDLLPYKESAIYIEQAGHDGFHVPDREVLNVWKNFV